jgi:hypothetical protein
MVLLHWELTMQFHTLTTGTHFISIYFNIWKGISQLKMRVNFHAVNHALFLFSSQQHMKLNK